VGKLDRLEACLKDWEERRARGEDFTAGELRRLGAKIRRARALLERAHKAMDDADDFAHAILRR
jgi:hypothetical protein